MTQQEYFEKLEFCKKFLQDEILKGFNPKNQKDFEVLGRAIHEVKSAPVICDDGSVYNSAFNIERYKRTMTKGQSAAADLIDRAFVKLRETLNAALPVEL